jgi:hypothetical protein
MNYRSLRGLAAHRGMVLAAAFVGMGVSGGAYAVDEPDQPTSLNEIVVVGTTPVPGMRVNADKVPGNVQTLYSSDLTKGTGTADLLNSMSTQLGSINFNDNSVDPFQPDVLYRGFEAFPILGTPQGLAVYENGARINEAFGDSVNWDLIPDIAINRVDIVSGSPVFGLNALGGAMSVSMKNGFTYQELESTRRRPDHRPELLRAINRLYDRGAAPGLHQDARGQSVTYFRNYRQTVANGDNSDYEGCTDVALLCQGDGLTPVMDTAGGYIPDLTNGGNTIIGQNDYESIHSQTWGGSLQFTSSEKLFGLGNAFAVGATVDASETKLFSGTEIGVMNSELTVLPSPYFVDTPEATDWSATPVALKCEQQVLRVLCHGRKVDLTDLRGTSLDGNNRFTHFDPAVGATYKLLPDMTVYAGYSTNNRAPTASEIECSDPLQPCLLPSNLAGDPPNLKRVISKTTEVGIRGRIVMPSVQGAHSWNAGVYRTNLEDDIYGISTSVYSDPTGVNAPGVPPTADSNDPGGGQPVPSPAVPRAYFGGVRITF